MVIDLKRKEDAVSPIIGIMLMIVVTIVIAAIVSVAASGILTQANSVSNSDATIEFVGLYTAGYGLSGIANIPKSSYQNEAGGIMFRVTGNKPVDLTKLKLDLASYTGGGGYVSLTYNDPVSTAYLPGGGTWNGGGSKSRLLPPEFMRGHRVVMYGVTASSEDLSEKMNQTIAEPGDMFTFVPEYMGNSPSLAIGLRKDDENGVAIQSGAMSADGGSYITLSDVDSGKQYVYHILVLGDYIISP